MEGGAASGDPFQPFYELPEAFVRPAVAACRLFNTVVDAAFYDVGTLVSDLARRDIDVETMPSREKLPTRILSLDALGNPEGSLLLIDAGTAPFVHRFDSVTDYLASSHPETRAVEIATVTGVGSSAFGSAALAWDVSVATGKAVLAIVPGYGVADIVQQALGGWFFFGLHDFLQSKSVVQTWLATAAPGVAKVGRGLSASVPDPAMVGDAPVFRTGSGSSDVLHALLDARGGPALRVLIGHSKGALVIGNALRSLAPGATDGMRVVTMGCPIAEDFPKVDYYQALGVIDLLGMLNMWFHRPNHWEPAWHTTNTLLPLPLHAEAITTDAIGKTTADTDETEAGGENPDEPDMDDEIGEGAPFTAP